MASATKTQRNLALSILADRYASAKGHPAALALTPLDNRIGNALVKAGLAERSQLMYRGKHSYRITPSGAAVIGREDLFAEPTPGKTFVAGNKVHSKIEARSGIVSHITDAPDEYPAHILVDFGDFEKWCKPEELEQPPVDPVRISEISDTGVVTLNRPPRVGEGFPAVEVDMTEETIKEKHDDKRI